MYRRTHIYVYVHCSGGWEVLDFGDVVVHVMSEEMRSYYDMESFYGAAEEVCCVSFCFSFRPK